MAQDMLRRAIASGKPYDDLPARYKEAISPYEWRIRVKEHCIQKGLPWATSLACTVASQQEYYEELVRQYKAWLRLFPYHLSDYLCRVARLTPFKYYSDMFVAVLKDERSYDRIPNFTAADALLVLGIGRNEYIAALNACKARRLMWRVNINREGIAREQLPQEPLPPSRLEHWWRVAVVNLAESEYRELGEEELAHLKTAALPAHAAGDIRVRDFQPAVLRGLLRKGLAYLEVPVEQGDRFAIPPLEGFVSNKTTEAGDAAADPLEALLYGVFVANSERMTVAELAGILAVPLPELQAAIGVASRLGFATRVSETPHAGLSGVGTGISGSASDLLGGDVTSADEHSHSASSVATAAAAALASGAAAGPTGGDGGGGALTPSPPAGSDAASYQAHQSALQLAAGLAAAPGGGAAGAGAVAVVVDSEATGYLMMGALSPGLKRHSVTLFEGGRVAGDDVMRELVDELWASYAAGQGFEGDMLRLTHYAAALGSLLEAVRASAGPGAALELLRKESLAGLAPTAAAKVLHHAYSAVVPISPLPPPVLPLSPYAPGPAHFGPTLEAASPWLSLALYQAARSGPQSFVLVCGQRVWRLPHPLDSCTHALVTLWDPEADPQRVRAHGAEGSGPTLVEAPFLLYTLNELLSRTAVLVQPLWCAEPESCPDVVDVPLPLPSAQPAAGAGAGVQGAGGGREGEGGAGGKGEEGAAANAAAGAVVGELGGGQRPDGSVCVAGIRQRGGDSVPVLLPAPLVAALRQLGIAACVGHLRVMRQGGSSSTSSTSSPPHHQHHSSHSHPHAHKQQQGSAAAGAAAGAAGSSGYNSEPSGVGRGGAAAAGGDLSAGAASDGAVAAAATTTPAGASGGGHGGGGVDGVAAWVPLSAHLGVPLHCLPLCKAVCRAASAAGFLTPEGRRTQQQAQLTLQNRLTKLLLSYTHAALDGSYGSAGPQQLAAVFAAAAGEGAGGTCAGSSAPSADSGQEGAEGSTAVGSVGPFSTAAATAGAGAGAGAGHGAGEDKVAPAAPSGEQGAAGSAAAAGAGLGAVLPLPAVNLSFDGHSLQPIRLRDSVQGLGCLCQG